MLDLFRLIFILPTIQEENLVMNLSLTLMLDEYFEEMTVDNIQPKSAMDDDLVGESAFHSSSGTEIIDEDAIDEEVRRGDERSNYAAWKVILAAVGLVVLFGAYLFLVV